MDPKPNPRLAPVCLGSLNEMLTYTPLVVNAGNTRSCAGQAKAGSERLRFVAWPRGNPG